MAEFKMSRNASGYYDGTAYNGMNQMIKEGEVWTYTNNGSTTKKEILIIKNHGTFCTALLLLSEPSDGCIEVNGFAGFKKYTDPRMVQYTYNTNVGINLTVLPMTELSRIREEIFFALQIEEPETESKPESKPEFNIPYDEMISLFGAETVASFCRCAFYSNKVLGSLQTAEEYMEKLIELEGDCGE